MITMDREYLMIPNIWETSIANLFEPWNGQVVLNLAGVGLTAR